MHKLTKVALLQLKLLNLAERNDSGLGEMFTCEIAANAKVYLDFLEYIDEVQREDCEDIKKNVNLISDIMINPFELEDGPTPDNKQSLMNIATSTLVPLSVKASLGTM